MIRRHPIPQTCDALKERMKIFGIAGWKNSGKTTLITGLLRDLSARGLTVSTIKHAHHAFDLDSPGKDSYQHRAAGAREVLIASHTRWALMHELRGVREPGLGELLAHLTPVDLVLVEGFKGGAHDKLEVRRGEGAAPLLAAGDPHIVAIAADQPVAAQGRPLFALDDVTGIADFIIRHTALAS